MLQLLILVQILFIPEFLCQSEINLNTLVSVAVIYRHGDRTPINLCPADPYRNASYWPAEFGQLTNIGKVQQLWLGQWLRDRYRDFIPNQYSQKDIHVVSTDVDRTLMSAEANLAGLYPPEGKQIWDTNLSWQPIPIHTIPEQEDYLLAMKKPCPKYTYLLNNLLKSSEFKEINRKNHDLYAYLARNTGCSVTNLEALEHIYDTLYIETLYNLTLPDWTVKVFPNKLRPWAFFSFAVECYTQDMAKLKTGPFFHKILSHFTNETRNQKRKMLMYSAHDMTIASILKSLDVFEYHSPPYTATILFELHSFDGNFYINLFYKNSSEPQKLILKGCEFDCPFENFTNILKLISLSYDEWEDECQLKFLGVLPFTILQSSVFAMCMVLLSLLIISLVSSIICARKSRLRQNYVRIPNEDV